MNADQFAPLELKTPTRSDSALREDHAVAAIWRYFGLGCDGEGLVLQIGGGAFR
jgi:hypothetical protein